MDLSRKKKSLDKVKMGTTEEAASAAEFDPEAVAQGKCIGCHGGDLTGGMGPALVGTKLI